MDRQGLDLTEVEPASVFLRAPLPAWTSSIGALVWVWKNGMLVEVSLLLDSCRRNLEVHFPQIPFLSP